MMADEVRTNAYAEALRQGRPAGRRRAGSRRGHGNLFPARVQIRRPARSCRDENAAVRIARELGRSNGYGDRIVCHEVPGHLLTLPEPVDVIVSELRGVLPFSGRSVSALIDARARLLKPGGILLPQRDSLWVALASAPEDHQRAVAPWSTNDLGFDLGRWSALLANSWIRAEPRAVPAPLSAGAVVRSRLPDRRQPRRAPPGDVRERSGCRGAWLLPLVRRHHRGGGRLQRWARRAEAPLRLWLLPLAAVGAARRRRRRDDRPRRQARRRRLHVDLAYGRRRDALRAVDLLFGCRFGRNDAQTRGVPRAGAHRRGQGHAAGSRRAAAPAIARRDSRRSARRVPRAIRQPPGVPGIRRGSRGQVRRRRRQPAASAGGRRTP